MSKVLKIVLKGAAAVILGTASTYLTSRMFK